MSVKLQPEQISNVKPHKLLLYTLVPEQNFDGLQEFFSVALTGREKVEFARAELELQKAVKLLTILTGGNINSLAILSALSLPGMTTAIVWTANAIFSAGRKETNINPEKSNRDSLYLLRGLNKVTLTHWYESLVDKLSVLSVPSDIKFLPGHPISGKFYRQHPLKLKQDYYYPVDSYYSLLFEEREVELIQILSDLGATKIVIEDQSQSVTSDKKAVENEQITGQEKLNPGTRVFEYIGKSWSPDLAFDASKYLWLDYEPIWKTVVDGRIRNGGLSASFEINIDFSHTIAGKIEGIEGLINEIESIHSIDLENLLNRTLHKRRVSVKFAGKETN